MATFSFEQSFQSSGAPLPLHTQHPCSFKHVEGDHGVVIHYDRMVGLDEAHAAHVCRQVEHMLTTSDDLFAIIIDPQIDQVKLVTEHFLLHMYCTSHQEVLLVELSGN